MERTSGSPVLDYWNKYYARQLRVPGVTEASTNPDAPIATDPQKAMQRRKVVQRLAEKHISLQGRNKLYV
jgi:hypothetical protein